MAGDWGLGVWSIGTWELGNCERRTTNDERRTTNDKDYPGFRKCVVKSEMGGIASHDAPSVPLRSLREENIFHAELAKSGKGLFDYDYEHPPSLFELRRGRPSTKDCPITRLTLPWCSR